MNKIMDQNIPQPGDINVDPLSPPNPLAGNPADPAGADAGVADTSEQPITDQQKQELLSIIDSIRQKLGVLNAQRFASDNRVERLRSELLQQVFSKLQLAGVDLTDRASVAQFIDNLKQSSPELAQMFESSMSALLGDPSKTPFGPPKDPNAGIDLGIPSQNMNNENQNENPASQNADQNIPQA